MDADLATWWAPWPVTVQWLGALVHQCRVGNIQQINVIWSTSVKKAPKCVFTRGELLSLRPFFTKKESRQTETEHECEIQFSTQQYQSGAASSKTHRATACL